SALMRGPDAGGDAADARPARARAWIAPDAVAPAQARGRRRLQTRHQTPRPGAGSPMPRLAAAPRTAPPTRSHPAHAPAHAAGLHGDRQSPRTHRVIIAVAADAVRTIRQPNPACR